MRLKMIYAGIALASLAATGVAAQTPPVGGARAGVYPPTSSADSAAIGIFTNRKWDVGKANSVIVRAENHGDTPGSVTITLAADPKDGAAVQVTPSSYTVNMSPGQTTAVEFTAKPPSKTRVDLTACATTAAPVLPPGAEGHPDDDCISGKSVQVK